MGQNFTIDKHHQDVLINIYNKKTNNNNNNINESKTNKDNDNMKKKMNKSSSNLTTVTNSANSTNSFDYNNLSSSHNSGEGYSLSNEDTSDEDYGFFEDIEPETEEKYFSDEELYCERKLQRAETLPTPLTEPPMYVLESSLRTQKLWYVTAGKRPRQPDHERRAMEKLWTQNFKESSVSYQPHQKIKEKPTIVKSLSAQLPMKNKNIHGPSHHNLIPKTNGNVIDTLEQNSPEEYDEIDRKEFDADIIMRGYQPFSNSVSKSFDINIGLSPDSISCITLQIPRFRIIKNKNKKEYAEYLVVITLGGVVKFGLWRRFSDFNNLVAKIEQYHDDELCNYSNSLLSWKCLLQKKCYFRCLDRDYLGFKCFLLERFLHDILFESSTSTIISEFLNIM